jgi:hypothetical protein
LNVAWPDVPFGPSCAVKPNVVPTELIPPPVSWSPGEATAIDA